jgi:hypothetical protein
MNSAAGATQFGAADLKIGKIMGVVQISHWIALVIAHAQLDFV